MTLVAVTMLRNFVRERDEWRDAIDARWNTLLKHCGLTALFLPNDVHVATSLLARCSPDGLVLTGGGECAALSGIWDARDLCESAAIEWAEAMRRPILGICRGMQVMLTRDGAQLEPVTGHVRSEHRVSVQGVPRTVNSYHNYGFRAVPPGYALERSEDGVVEAAWHDDRRLLGLMWHPERGPGPCPADIDLISSHFGANR